LVLLPSILKKQIKMLKLMKAGLILAISGSVLFVTGCGIQKMIKKAGSISYEAKPNPLELHGDSVKITVTGVFPAKFFHKKAIVMATPVVKYAGGEKELKSVTLRGDKVEGAGQNIRFTEGGKFTYTDQFLFVKGMEKSEVILRATAQYKSKTTNLPEVSIAKGVITTPLLLKPDYKAIIAADKFDKNPTVTQKANIYYLVDSWEIRNIELNSDESENMIRFINRASKSGSELSSMEIYGFASPEGELSRNSKLSDNRADEAYKVMLARFNKAKLKGLDKKDGFYKKVVTDFEDWDGLKQMLQSSTLNGKDEALNIINTLGDPEAREAEFKKIASFDPIYDAYFPKLRRAEINLVARIKTRNDEQIYKLALETPDSLGMEELLYASTLVFTNSDKLAIYKAFSRLFPEDYRGFNNVGAMYVSQGKINEAQAEFEKAQKIAGDNATIKNNLGVVAAMKGDRKTASNYFDAAGSLAEVNHNKGNLQVAAGKYSIATSSYGSECSFNAALAKLLSGNTAGATQTLDCSDDKDSAEGFYLRAVIAARSSNKEGVVGNLTKAISSKPELKNKAKSDMEFEKFSADLAGVLN
jgi:tetratricopeptide (TPR) repeat protein